MPEDIFVHPTSAPRTRALRKALRLAHRFAMIAFMAGILGCAVLNATGHLGDMTQYSIRRGVASDLVWLLIVPGLVALVATGMALSMRTGMGMPRRDWVSLKQGLSLILLANGLFFLVPRVLRIDSLLRNPPADPSVLTALQRGEDWLGSVNFLLGLAMIAIATWMSGPIAPRSGRSR